MSMTVDAIYEHGIFKPVTGVPVTLREHDRVRITIETDNNDDLLAEFAEWDAASDADIHVIQRKLEDIG